MRSGIRATRLTLILLALLVAASIASADETPVIPPDMFVYCTVCHGVELKGNHVIQAPRLSGMQAWNVELQLLAFKRGWRGTHADDLVGMEMQPMAAILSDKEIAEAARYVSATVSEPPTVTIIGDARRGRDLYATCQACHAADGNGVEALGAPALTGLNDWYLVRQTRNFKDGTRGSHKDDIRGAQMRAAAQVLADDDAIQDVVAYINSLRSR
ncbi:MAG: c-type cytochrome [Woeseia sp.]